MVIRPVLRPGNNKNEHRIAISIHDGGKNPTIKLIPKRKISKTEWNPNGTEDKKNWIRSINSDFRAINKEIYDMLIKLRAEKTGETPADLIHTKRGKYKPFLSWAKEQVSLIRNSSTKVNNEQALAKLTIFLEETDDLSMPLQDINKSFCKRYYNWLLTRYSPSSTNQYFGVFRTIFKSVVGEEANNLQIDYDPFDKFKYESNKAKNTPLTKTEYNRLKNYSPPNRNHLLAKNLWLFQFSQGLRVKDAMLLKWGDLKYDAEKDEVIWHTFTNKTNTRIVRKLDISVIELLLPCIERYSPDVSQAMRSVKHELEKHKEALKTLKKEAPGDLTPEEIIMKLSSGYSPEEMRDDMESIKYHKELIEDHEENIRFHESYRVGYIGETLNDLRKNHPHDYIWDKPLKESFDRGRLQEKHFEAYQRCVASYDGYLKRIAKKCNFENPLSSHIARHTATYFMIDEGMEMTKVSKFLTHSTHDTTEIYINRLGLQTDELSTFLAHQL